MTGRTPRPAPEQLIAEFQASVPYALDDFQLDAIRALAGGHSVLVAAPTGTGKTVVAEFGVAMARACGLRAFYTTPIKALSNQKYRDFRARYGERDVGLLTGDISLHPHAPLVIMTTEVLRNMLVTGEARPAAAPPGGHGAADGRPGPPVEHAPLQDVGAIVFDEVHYMGDPERGTAWEEAILLAPRHVPLVCLSATVPNADEVAEWIREAHGELTCIFHEERAVPLENRYWLPDADPATGGFTVYPVLDASGRPVYPRLLEKVGGELAGRVRWGGATSQGFRGDETAGLEGREPREVPAAWRVVRYLEGERLTPAIFFVFSRRATEEAALACLALRPVPHAAELVREARARLSDLDPEDRALRQVALLFRCLPRGVAVHHAGLLPQIKMLVEELFQAGRLRAVFATDTLAVGVNMPARTVVVAELQKFDGVERRLLTPNEYRQMTGRAGRRGLDERGVSLVLYSPWVTFPQAVRVMRGELLPLDSAFRPTYSTAMNLWLRPEDEERLADLYARSLRRFQHDRTLKELTERKQRLEDTFERDKASGDLSQRAVWEGAQELSQVEHALRRAQRTAALEARRTVEGLATILTRYDYLRDGRPTYKAPYLRALFDTNALTLSELLTTRQLEGLEPAEIAEAISWFATDREAPMRGLALTDRLYRLRDILDHLHGGVLREEQRHGLQMSRPLPPEFHGVALAWAAGDELAAVARRARIPEGDLVGALQKTLDLLGQLHGAAQRGPLGAALAPKLETADRLLRRGVVEASYRWAVGGVPALDEAAAAEGWDVPALFDDEPGSRQPGRRPAPSRRSPSPSGAGRRTQPGARSPRPSHPPGARTSGR